MIGRARFEEMHRWQSGMASTLYADVGAGENRLEPVRDDRTGSGSHISEDDWSAGWLRWEARCQA